MVYKMWAIVKNIYNFWHLNDRKWLFLCPLGWHGACNIYGNNQPQPKDLKMKNLIIGTKLIFTGHNMMAQQTATITKIDGGKIWYKFDETGNIGWITPTCVITPKMENFRDGSKWFLFSDYENLQNELVKRFWEKRNS